MKKIIYIVLAIVIIAGIAIIATIGLNVDIMYKAHEQVNIYVGKEADIKDIESIAKEVFENQKIKITKIEVFNDAFAINTESVSDEQIETLKQKVGEKYSIEDTSNTVIKSSIPKLRLRDLIKPYVNTADHMSIIASTLIILAFMAIKFKKIGSIKIVLQTSFMLVLAETLLLSVVSLTRFPVNEYIVPAGITVYFATIIAISIQATKELNEKNIKKEVKE